MKKSWYFLIFIALFLLLFYWRSFNNFFFQDDFNLLFKSVKEDNLIDAFNIFKKPTTGFKFYRPFSIQLFWLSGYRLFGLSPFGYHLINFIFFVITIFLVFILVFELTRNERTALLTSFFYGFAGSHFYRLFFLTQFQEVSLAVFTFSTLILFLKKNSWTPILFILSLTTKETAVMIVPMMIVLIIMIKKYRNKENIKLLFYCLVILFFYLYGRIFIIGLSKERVYKFYFNPKQILNNYFWYGLWSFGLPEAFVNVELFKLPTIFNPELFRVFGNLGNWTLFNFWLFMFVIAIPVVNYLKRINKKLIISSAVFILFLLPVGFFPFHKFPYSLSVPLLGSSFFLADALEKINDRKIMIVCFIYILFSFNAYRFNLLNHWASKKATVAEKVFNYFKVNYPNGPKNINIYFRNTAAPICIDLDQWRPSQEISYAIGEEDGLSFLYDKNLTIYYEDFDLLKHLSSQSLVIDSQQFLK